MNNPIVSNPNDFKVVEFHNSTDFTFTPEMGCMYDGRSISGITGAPGINAGESLTLPYHVAQQLAKNLAKVVMTKSAGVDAAGIPTGVALWDTESLERTKNSYLTELYTEERPVPMSDTDKLMAKVEEYKGMVESLLANSASTPPVSSPEDSQDEVPNTPVVSSDEGYQDKAEVITELEKRGIAHDKRKNKADLEALLAPVAE